MRTSIGVVEEALSMPPCVFKAGIARGMNSDPQHVYYIRYLGLGGNAKKKEEQRHLGDL